MVELVTIIALAIITHILEANLYELHPMDKRVFNDLINNNKKCLAKSI
jgi:hypothetical protein